MATSKPGTPAGLVPTGPVPTGLFPTSARPPARIPDQEPFTEATFGQGGTPAGKREADLGPDHAGGRHAGAILDDPVRTLEKLERPAGPKPVAEDDAKIEAGAARQD